MVMDDRNEIFLSVIKQITAVADWLPSDQIFSPKTSLREDLGFDSLAIVRLQISLEDNFNFRFDPVNTDFISVFNSIENLTTFLMELQVLNYANGNNSKIQKC
jgi:acyl carrier protein